MGLEVPRSRLGRASRTSGWGRAGRTRQRASRCLLSWRMPLVSPLPVHGSAFISSHFSLSRPVYLRALIDGTEDKIDEFKRKRPTTLHLRFTKTSATRAAALSSLAAVISEKPLSKVQVPEIAAFAPEDECSETDAAVYFGVSPEHSLPPASTPTTTTSLLIPFALSQSIEPSDDYSPSSGVPLSRFVFAHRAAYALHAKRVDALLGLLERQGAFLDPQIASHEVRDDRDTGALIGIKIEFVGRSEEEVRRILSCAGGQTTVDDGEEQWFFLSSRPRVTGNEDDDLPLGAEAANFLVFPTVSLLSLESTPAPPPPARSASSGIPTTPSDISLSLSDISLSLSDTEMLPSPFSSSSVTSPSSFVDEQDNSAHWEDLPSPDAALSAFSGASSIFEIDQELDIFSSAVWSDAESRSGRDTGSSSSSAGSMAMSMEPF